MKFSLILLPLAFLFLHSNAFGQLSSDEFLARSVLEQGHGGWHGVNIRANFHPSRSPIVASSEITRSDQNSCTKSLKFDDVGELVLTLFDDERFLGQIRHKMSFESERTHRCNAEYQYDGIEECTSSEPCSSFTYPLLSTPAKMILRPTSGSNAQDGFARYAFDITGGASTSSRIDEDWHPDRLLVLNTKIRGEGRVNLALAEVSDGMYELLDFERSGSLNGHFRLAIYGEDAAKPVRISLVSFRRGIATEY